MHPRGQKSENNMHTHTHIQRDREIYIHSHHTIDLEGMGKYCNEMPEDVSSLIDSTTATTANKQRVAHHVHGVHREKKLRRPRREPAELSVENKR